MTDVGRLIRSHIDRAAAKADRKPSDGQKEAGNYRKGKIRFHGIDISIENPRGSIRSGTDKGGKPWRVALPDHYGYFKRTEGSDGDHVDCYIGRHPLSSRVFVVDQVDADSKEHDEHKIMLGYTSEEQALSAYRRAFSDGRGDDRIGSVKEMDISAFKRWLHREGGLPKYADGGAVGYADGGAPDDKPPFDPSQPFQPAQAESVAKPAFDPSKPFEAASPEPPKEHSLVDTAQGALGRLSGVPMIGPIAGGLSKVDPALVGEVVRNAPASAGRFAHDLAQPFIHPIDTATSLKNLGMGVLEKTGLVSGDEHEKYADAVGKFFADRYGGIENAKHTLATDPVGMAGDLSAVLTGGGSLAARAPGVIGKVGEVAGAVGRTVDPLRAAATVGKGVANTAAEVAGVTTGVGAQPLKIAAKAGYEGGPGAQAFRENLTGAAPLEDAVNEARGAVTQMRVERGKAYRQQMGPIKADSTVLDFNKIDQAVSSAQGVKTYAGRSGTGPAQILSPKTAAIRKEMDDAVSSWKNLDPAEFHTPEGIDALKQQLGDIRDATQPHTPDRVVADRVYNAVRQTIVDQVPEYAKVMKGYEQASNQLKEIEKTLSLNPKASIDTALRKLQSALRDNVNTSFGRRTELANFLVNAGAPHLMERLAGQSLKAWAPRGLARITGSMAAHAVPAVAVGAGAGFPAAALTAAATLPVMSPRLMGEVAYGAGRAARAVQPFGIVPRGARQIGQVSGATVPFGNTRNPYQP